MDVQVRIKGARGLVGEQGGREIARPANTMTPTGAQPGCREAFGLLQHCLNRPLVRVENALIFTEECDEQTSTGKETSCITSSLTEGKPCLLLKQGFGVRESTGNFRAHGPPRGRKLEESANTE